MKKREIKSIQVMQSEIEEVENRIEEQILINKKIKKKRLILVAIMFAVMCAMLVIFNIGISSFYERRIEEYRTYTEERIAEYKQFLE